MRLARVAQPEGVSFVVIDGPDGSQTAREIADHPFGNPSFTGKKWPIADVRFLAPILPSKVIGVGRNYHAHAAELGNAVPDEPMVFLKPSTAVVGPGAAITVPAASKRVDYEGELAVVIGRPCHDVRAEDASSVILGYTCANDVTARDLRSDKSPWLRSKGYDSFCPLGPWIDTDVDPADVTVRTLVDGDLKQDGHTGDLTFTVAELVEFCSAIMTLLPGDVILTGTPEGVGPLASGNEVTVSIPEIGDLSNPVAP